MDVVVIGNTGVIQDSVVVADGGDHFIGDLLFIFFVHTDLVKGAAFCFALIIEIFAAELNLTAEVTKKAGLIPALGGAAIDSKLIGSCSKAGYFAGFVGGIHVKIKVAIGSADILGPHGGKALGFGFIKIHGIQTILFLRIGKIDLAVHLEKQTAVLKIAGHIAHIGRIHRNPLLVKGDRNQTDR